MSKKGLTRTGLTAVAMLVGIVAGGTLGSCNSDKPPVAPAIVMRDSLPIMTSYGVSKMISDSGVMKYKVVTEEWQVYDKTSPTKQTFIKGLLLEQFNEKFHAEMYITADTAYWYDQNLWELRGRVCVWNKNGTVFRSELLYWDMARHEFYSNKFSHLVTPDREVDGHSFHSNDQMTQYEVNFSHAVFSLPDELHQDSTATPPTTPTTPVTGKAMPKTGMATAAKASPVTPTLPAPTGVHRIIPQKLKDAPTQNKPPGGHFR